jgi:hypothetical protein
MTLEQQQRGGGIAVPINGGDDEITSLQSEIDIDLGSPFALELGFPPSIKPYVEPEEESVSSTKTGNASSSPNKKKKKKSKKKRGKK